MEDILYYGKFFLIGVLPFQLIGFFVCLHRIRAQKHSANFCGIITPLLTFFFTAVCAALIYANMSSSEQPVFGNGITALFLAIIYIPIGATANLLCAFLIPTLASFIASTITRKI